MKFYRCKKCNNVMIIKDGENNPICCNEAMEELIPGSVDAALEKHVPVVSLEEEYKIIVGEVIHPMQEEHYIEWIALEFEDGIIKMFDLKPNQEPVVTYKAEKKVKSAYAYCNLHGLWKTEV